VNIITAFRDISLTFYLLFPNVHPELMMKQIPNPTVERACSIYNLLPDLERESVRQISSSELSDLIGVNAAVIRKDLSLIGISGVSGARYNTAKLRQDLEEKLELGSKRKSCVVGIGKLGSAILDFGLFNDYGFEITAGFDSNMNTIETKKTGVKLYPAFQMSEVVRQEKIELAFLCVPSKAAQNSTDRLIEGGIRGILNFTPVTVKSGNKDVFISRIDVLKEMRTLSALISASAKKDFI
jgi:redox-sensing transcriptional repressor